MFTPFKKGANANEQGWDDTPDHVSGRFHAHPISRPTSPHASTSTNTNINHTQSPFSPFRASPSLVNTSTSIITGAIPRIPRKGATRRVLIQVEEEEGAGSGSNERWLLLRPSKQQVETVLNSWYKRYMVIVALPCLFVWIWCALPFPVTDFYQDKPTYSSTSLTYTSYSAPAYAIVESLNTKSDIRRAQVILEVMIPSTLASTTNSNTNLSTSKYPPLEPKLPVDANFYFFLIVYYGTYLAVALVFVTKLFDLYRLNWWSSKFGGSISYFFFWTLSLSIGFFLHYFGLDGLPSSKTRLPSDPNNSETWDWERKTIWVALAFFTMAGPAAVCFAKLRADRRQSYRHSLTAFQKTFLDSQLVGRIPRSYKRFLWFLVALMLSLLALIIGQGFATVYLSTLPHSNVDGVTYVYTWILSVQALNSVSNWVLQRKVRSRALVFVFRYYYFLVYYIFYRNLFARLRSPDQAIAIQLLSSSFVIVWYPVSMSKTFHRFLKWSMGFDIEWEEYAESVASMLYLRNLSENVTMVAFLGWMTILHFGPNSQLYPFFSFESDVDPYNYRLTVVASLTIWFSELISSFFARTVIWFCYKLDVTNVGLDEFREHPELVVACVIMSIHVLMDMLMFLIKLNFK